MIIGVRSVLICERVEQDDAGRANYFGICGASIMAESNPGFLHIWAALHVEVDRKATQGHVRVEAADYSQIFPFDLPAGWWLAGMAFPLIVPVLREGPLTVAVFDEGRKGKPFRFRWNIEISPDAKVLDEAAGRDFVEAGKKAGEIIADNLAVQGKTKY